MEFLSLTRGIEIGANSYLLRLGGKSLLLDCGMHPKRSGMLAVPEYSWIGGDQVDAVVVTHAHQDHIGSLPVLTRQFPEAPVFMTPATRRIGDTMLHNSVNVMTRQREEDGVSEYPLFTHRGVELSRGAWQPRRTGRAFDLRGDFVGNEGNGEATIEFFDAGHILGSVGVLVRFEGRTLFYTGDVHFDDQTLMQKAAFPENGVDVLVMETTRGDSPTPEGFTREAEKQRLAEGIHAAFEDDAGVTIPVFALGKTQELLAMLWELKLAGSLPTTPVYIGGLSTKITEAYDALAESERRSHPELLLLENMAPYVVSGREIEGLRPRKRSIYALSSGMMTENTLSNIFANHLIEDPKQRIFFVGYSDPESPSGRLRAAAPGDSVVLDPRRPGRELRCQVKEFNFSAHATRESLAAYATRLRPKKILLVHGDQPAVDWFSRKLYESLPDTEVIIPQPGEPVSL